MNRFSKLAVGLAVLPVLAFAAPANAAVQSYIEGGDIYKAKNLTKDGTYADPATADACNTVTYRVRLHNPGPDQVLNNVTVQASIPQATATQNVSTIILRASNASPAETSDTATLNISSAQSLSYVNGSTQLLNSTGGFVKTLPDGVTGAGVNIGDLGISLNEIKYVTFNEKVSCPPVTPPVVSLACTDLSVSNIDRTHYDFTVKSSVANATVTSYVFTAKDANGNVVDTFTKTTSDSSAVYHFNQSNAGVYTVSAVVNTDHGSASSSACSKQITVAAVPATPATPVVQGKSTELPNTGAGDVVGLFAGASAAGTAAHAIVSRRRR